MRAAPRVLSFALVLVGMALAVAGLVTAHAGPPVLPVILIALGAATGGLTRRLASRPH